MLVPTIGIEVHVELKSNSKVFSRSKNNFNDPINTNVSVLDLAYPGTLPRLNHEVINMALKTCLALNCKINQTMHFDRKNYFYPDLPKGFQITQKDTPIGYDGYLEINTKNGPKKGRDLKYSINITFEESYLGVEKEISIYREEECPTCHGEKAKPGTKAEKCTACNGTGTVKQTVSTILGQMQTTKTCPNCGGEGTIIKEKCPDCKRKRTYKKISKNKSKNTCRNF